MQNIPKQKQSANPVRVAVCIATFQRAKLLQGLLDALSHLSFSKVSQPSIQIVIVDNDAARNAEPICQPANFPWTIRYVCEPQRGIARARNRAIEVAVEADFLAFIDDDEVPVARWLDELLWAQSQFQSDVVSGAVIPAFAEDVPAWIRNGKFFHRPVFETGFPVRLCSTNNCLVRTRILDTVPGFDEQFNFTGGEDTHFFLRVRDSGFRMVFSKEAIVYESISAERANFSWLLRRGFQAGNSWALCERNLHPQGSVAALRIMKELIHISRGTLQFLVSPFKGKAHILRSLQTLSSGVGTLAGVAGHRFLPYTNAGSGSKTTSARRTTGNAAHL